MNLNLSMQSSWSNHIPFSQQLSLLRRQVNLLLPSCLEQMLNILSPVGFFLLLLLVEFLHVLYVVGILFVLSSFLSKKSVDFIFYQLLMLLLELWLFLDCCWTPRNYQMLGEDLPLVFDVLKPELLVLGLFRQLCFLFLVLLVANLLSDEVAVCLHVFSPLPGVFFVQPLGMFNLFFSAHFLNCESFLRLLESCLIIAHCLFNNWIGIELQFLLLERAISLSFRLRLQDEVVEAERVTKGWRWIWLGVNFEGLHLS